MHKHQSGRHISATDETKTRKSHKFSTVQMNGENAHEVGISLGSMCSILEHMHVRKFVAHWVPNFLSKTDECYLGYT